VPLHDVVVVGAGPSGAACAHWLAEAGHDVVMVEKKRFPREKTCGDGLTPRAVKQLDDMGLGAQLADHHRFVGLRSIAFGRTLELEWPDTPGFPRYGYVVTRHDLDDMVAQRAVKAGATLGDPYADPYPARSVLIVDQRASAGQREALVEFARHMGGKLLAHIEKVVAAPINMQVLHAGDQNGRATLRAGTFAAVETRSIGAKDHLCGNEATFYPPLTATTHSMPAVAMTDSYEGPGLGVSWTLHDKRSAFVGSFTAAGQ